MVILTPRFSTLLLVVAVAQAAYVPQRPAPDTQVHFRPRAIADGILPSVPTGFLPSLNPLGSNFLRRRLPTSPPSPIVKADNNKKGKSKRPGKFGVASVPAPIPNSARPVSEQKFHKTIAGGHKPNTTAPVNVADFSNQSGSQDHSQGGRGKGGLSQDKHGQGEHEEHHGGHHEGYKGEEHEGYKAKYHEGYDGEHHGRGKDEGSKGEGKHEPDDKRSTVATADITPKHSNSRLFRRTSTYNDLSGVRYYVKKAHTDHGHDRDHKHDHDHDHDHDHHHDHDHDHERRNIIDDLLDGPDNDFDGEIFIAARAEGGQPEPVHESDQDILDLDVNVKREIESTSRRRPHQTTKASGLARRHYPIVIHDIGHGHRHSHVAYHVTGKRGIVASRGHGHEHDHEYIYEHKHEHKHNRREIVAGVPGSISIVSPTAGDAKPVEIASLVLSPVNGTSKSAPKNTSFVLNASNETRTKVFLVATDSKVQNGTTHVNIQIPIFDGEQVQDVPWCASYDPAPNAPGPLGVSKCGEQSAHSSQLFEYSIVGGTVRPIWNSASGEASNILDDASVAGQTPFERLPIVDEFQPEFAAASNSTSANVTAAAAGVEPSNSTHTEGIPNSSNTTHAPTSEKFPPRTVALVFTPDDPQAPKVVGEDVTPVEGSNNKTEAVSPLAVINPSTTSSIVTATHTISSKVSTVSAQNVFAASSIKSDSASPHTSQSSNLSATLSAADISSPSTPMASSSATASSASAPKIAAAEATSVRVLDAGAPYEWMFTPGGN